MGVSERIVITGGAGFIGSHLVDELIRRGNEVHVIDDLSNGRRDQVPSEAEFHELDIVKVDELCALTERIGPISQWYHLAAQADVRVSVDQPTLDATVNVVGTVAVLAAARIHGAKVLFASTGGAIYGEANRPASEQHLELPPSPYGAAKLAAEKYVAQDARLGGASHVIVRFANVYGPRQDPNGEAGVVAIFAGLARASQPARVFGDGEQTRDYVYVADVVDATIAAAQAASEGKDHDLRDGGQNVPIYNVGTGRGTSVLELWAEMSQVAGTSGEYDLYPARDGEIRNSVIDASFARSRLGVQIDTDISEGLEATYEWICSRVEV